MGKNVKLNGSNNLVLEKQAENESLKTQIRELESLIKS